MAAHRRERMVPVYMVGRLRVAVRGRGCVRRHGVGRRITLKPRHALINETRTHSGPHSRAAGSDAISRTASALRVVRLFWRNRGGDREETR